MDGIKMEGSLQDEDPISDDLTRFSSSTPTTSVHEAAGAKHGNSLHDRFTALASPSSGSRRVKLEITTSNFDFLSTPVGSAVRNCQQKNGPSSGNTENRIGTFNMGSRELKDKPESEHENKPPSSVKSPGSYKLNPLASTFDASAKKKFNILKSSSEFTPNKSQIDPFPSPLEHTPTKAQFSPFAPPFDFTPTKVRAGSTLTRTKTGTDTQVQLREDKPSTDDNHTSKITSHFGLEKEVSIVRSPDGGSNEDTRLGGTEGVIYGRSTGVEKGNNSPNPESEDSDESFEFAPEIEEEEEFGDIKFKQLVDNHWRFCLEGANITKGMVTDPAKRLDGPGFKTIPDTIKSRYPQMATFLATLVIQETVASRSNDTPSLPTWSGKSQVCTSPQTVPIQKTIAPEIKHAGAGLSQELPVIDALARTGESLERPGTCVGVSSSSKGSTALDLKGQAGENAHGCSLGKAKGSAEETKTEQVSRRRDHSKKTIVSAKDPNGKKINLGFSSIDDEMIMSQQDSKKISIGNLTTSDDGFFRDSEADFTLSTPTSGRSSISSEGSITFSLREDSISGKESDKAGGIYFEDAERSRRSPGPSPSPKRGLKLNSSTARLGSFDPFNFELGRDEDINDPKIVTEGWLNQLSISSEKDNIILPTGRPSVLARIHSRGSVCDDDESDSDGVAPGEWIKPIELIKKEPPKLKTGDEALMRDSFGVPFKGPTSSRGSRRPGQYNSPRSQSITPQTGFHLDKLSEKEKEIAAWREKGMIATITGDKKTATSLTEGKREQADLVPQRQNVLFTSPYGRIDEDSLKNNSNKMPAIPLQQHSIHRGGSIRGTSRGGSAIKSQKESVISDVSARWQRFTDQPGSVAQESLCLVDIRAQTVPIASETAPGKAHEAKQDPFEAKSETFMDKRFATKRSFYQEAMVKENLDRKTAEALAALIKDSRDDAQRKSREVQMGGKAGRLRPVGLQVANVIVKTNANGEREWTVEQPIARQLEEEEPKMEADEKLPRRQGKRRF
ncbi:hypothetical protein DFP73DRAFT_632936 [Morchella snyderi]|nr:hypothetical protein DFP73DRAFT_632936 [Morchella snyderi]